MDRVTCPGANIPQVTRVRRLTLRPGVRRSPVGQRLAGLAIDRLFSPADASVKGIRRFGADRRRIKKKKSYAASRHAGYCPADSSSSSTAPYLTAVLIIYSLPVLHGVPFLLVLATRSAPFVSLREALHRSHRVLASPRNPKNVSHG